MKKSLKIDYLRILNNIERISSESLNDHKLEGISRVANNQLWTRFDTCCSRIQEKFLKECK